MHNHTQRLNRFIFDSDSWQKAVPRNLQTLQFYVSTHFAFCGENETAAQKSKSPLFAYSTDRVNSCLTTPCEETIGRRRATFVFRRSRQGLLCIVSIVVIPYSQRAYAPRTQTRRVGKNEVLLTNCPPIGLNGFEARPTNRQPTRRQPVIGYVRAAPGLIAEILSEVVAQFHRQISG